MKGTSEERGNTEQGRRQRRGSRHEKRRKMKIKEEKRIELD